MIKYILLLFIDRAKPLSVGAIKQPRIWVATYKLGGQAPTWSLPNIVSLIIGSGILLTMQRLNLKSLF
jgi:hypothetical protein